MGEDGRSHEQLMAENARLQDRLRELKATIVSEVRVGRPGFHIIEDTGAYAQAQQALDQSQKRYQLVFENVGDILCTLDRHLRITSISRSVKAVLGYEPEELRGGRLGTLKILPAESLDRAMADVQRVLDGKPLRHERYVLISRSGQPVHLEARGSLLPGPAGAEEIIVVMRDVTGQVRAQEALRESEEKYRQLVEQALDGIIIIQDNIICLANPQVCRLLGYPSAEIVGTPYTRLLKPEDVPEAQHFLADRMADRDPNFLTVAKLRNREGRWLDVEVSVGPASFGGRSAVLVVLRDATERTATQDALRRSENLLANIIGQSPISTWIADSEGTMIRLNQACRRLLGITSDDQVVDKYNLYKDDVFISQGLMGKLHEVFSKAQTVRVSLDYDFSLVRHVRVPQAAHRLLDVTIFPIKDSKGRVVNAVVQQEDVTELREREEQLRQAQKMEAVGKLAGGVAHDFRTQLTVVNGYCELLLKRLAEDDPSREAVREIHAAAQRSIALTNQLLAYSRKQVLQSRPINLSDLILDIRGMLLQALGPNIELSLDLAENLRLIEADPNQMQQVIMNVVLNGRDAMPDGGTLFIKIENEQLDEEYVRRHNGASTGPHVKLTITDTGIGMNEETRKRMFDPFFTTKPAGKGTGLGLSMVYGFVRQSGGHICVTSRPGKGAKLKIHFPCVKASAQPAATEGPTAAD